MIKEYGNKNYEVLINKLNKIDDLSFDEVIKKLNNKVICVGSGLSYTTAYLSSKILNKYFDLESTYMTPREVLNSIIPNDTSIILYSYSATSKDTCQIRNNYKNVITITGRKYEEIENTTNIFSYYLNEPYERGLILYENIIIPITLLLNLTDKSFVKELINKFNSYKLELNNMNNIAIFSGDYTVASSLYLKDMLLETGICKFDIYEKKDFSHGQYNYFMNNKYDGIFYFKQKDVSYYELILIDKLKGKNLVIVESDYNDIKAEYELMFKSFIIFNELIKNKKLKLYNEEFKCLYNYEGDFK